MGVCALRGPHCFMEVPKGIRMKAYACYDAKGTIEDRNMMQKALKGIESELGQMGSGVAAA